MFKFEAHEDFRSTNKTGFLADDLNSEMDPQSKTKLDIFYDINIKYARQILQQQKGSSKNRKIEMPKKYGKRKQTPDLHETQLYDKVTKLESEILSELEYLNKKRNNKFDCIHCYEQLPKQYEPEKNYYDEFWKSYLINIVCMKRYQEYWDWIKKITKKIGNIEKVYIERKRIMEPIDSKRKKKNSELNSNEFQCVQCGKRYKDQDSLNIHLSIKHGNEQIKLEANIQELNNPYIQNSDSEKNYYEDDDD